MSDGHSTEDAAAAHLCVSAGQNIPPSYQQHEFGSTEATWFKATVLLNERINSQERQAYI